MIQQLDRLFHIKDVERFSGLDHSTVYRRIKAGSFPPPVRVGTRRSAWRESDLVRWQQDLVEGVRDPIAQKCAEGRRRSAYFAGGGG
jgi:prophage regulatory protein